MEIRTFETDRGLRHWPSYLVRPLAHVGAGLDSANVHFASGTPRNLTCPRLLGTLGGSGQRFQVKFASASTSLLFTLDTDSTRIVYSVTMSRILGDDMIFDYQSVNGIMPNHDNTGEPAWTHSVTLLLFYADADGTVPHVANVDIQE